MEINQRSHYTQIVKINQIRNYSCKQIKISFNLNLMIFIKSYTLEIVHKTLHLNSFIYFCI